MSSGEFIYRAVVDILDTKIGSHFAHFSKYLTAVGAEVFKAKGKLGADVMGDGLGMGILGNVRKGAGAFKEGKVILGPAVYFYLP